jgi:AmmeMemoRadiSam system protein A
MKRGLSILIFFMLIIVLYSSAQERAKSTLTDADKEYLLNLARESACWYLKDKSLPKPEEKELSGGTVQKLGCFVTLQHKVKGLRGCIGIFERSQPLYKNVISRAIAAATQDYRFADDPVTYEELKDIKIEISVLTEPVDLGFNSPEDLLNKLRPMIDGVIIQTRFGSSTYLPQVWEHFNNNKEDFLSSLCQKHGAPADTWKKEYKNLKAQTYQAVVFSEESYGRKIVGKNGAVTGKKCATVLGAVKLLAKPPANGGTAPAGTRLAPGTIVTWDSDIKE